MSRRPRRGRQPARPAACFRALAAIAAINRPDLDGQLSAALAIAARMLGLPSALVAELKPGEVKVLAAHGHVAGEDAALAARCVPALMPHATARSLHGGRPASLIGVRIDVDGVPFGFACFYGMRGAARRYSQAEYGFVELLGRWLEHMIGCRHSRAALLEISARRDDESRLRRAASVFKHAREGILITAPDGRIEDVNEAFTRITGYERDEVLGRNPSMLQSGRQDRAFYRTLWQTLASQGHWQGEVWNRRKSGEVYVELLTISAVRDTDGAIGGYVGLFSDITAQKARQRELEHRANYDALTGLPNRRLLDDRLEQAIIQARRYGSTLAVVYLDLDGFKQVNDTFGHACGDELLITLAARMRQAVRDSDTVARLGGDEFVAVLHNLPSLADCIPLLVRLREACLRPVRIGGAEAQVSASIGVAFMLPESGLDADQLLLRADQAMYYAKQHGKNRYHIYDGTESRGKAA